MAIYRDKKFWNKIKREYLEGGKTKAQICRENGLSINTMNSRLRNEGWAEAKKNYQKKHQEVEQVETESIQEAKNRFDETNKKICEDIGHTLLNKIAMSCDTIDVEDRAGIRQLTASLKDLKELKLWSDKLDIIEQEARIKKLQKEAEDKDDKNVSITVSFTDDIDKLV